MTTAAESAVVRSITSPQVREGEEPTGVSPYVFTEEQKQLIKDTIARDQSLTDNELRLFLYVAQRRGLDPLARQLYAIRRKGKITHQTSIDGFRLIAARTGQYAGRDRVIYEGKIEIGGGRTVPEVAVVTVYREVGGIPRAWTGEARWEEFYPGSGNEGLMYRTKPHTMLAKCAEAQALRAAFPEELGGLYTGDEMAQAGEPDDAGSRQAQRETTGPQPEPAVEPDPEEAVKLDPGAFILPGTPGKAWGGKAGQPLKDLKTKLLVRVLDWTRGKLSEGEDSENLVLLALACDLVISGRAAGEMAEPAEEPREPGEEDA